MREEARNSAASAKRAVETAAEAAGKSVAEFLTDMFGMDTLETAIEERKTDNAYRAAAHEIWCLTDKVQVDDDAVVSIGDAGEGEGAWVAGWVWVPIAKMREARGDDET